MGGCAQDIPAPGDVGVAAGQARDSPEGTAVGAGKEEPGDSRQVLEDVQHEQRHVLGRRGGVTL